MTEQEINQLTGLELDASVAEHVFNWRWLRCLPGKHGYGPVGQRALWPPDTKPDADEWKNADMTEDIIREFGVFMPSYSTDISHAWEVVTAMVERGKLFIVKGDGLRKGDHEPKWTVLCDNRPRTDATSAPLAICRAALKVYLT